MSNFNAPHSSIRKTATAVLLCLVLSAAASPVRAWDGNGPLRIDHVCTDLSRIPSENIELVKSDMRMHFAHTSHGMQISEGLFILERAYPELDFAYENCVLPTKPAAFNIFNGQTSATYITPDLYWASEAGMNETRAVLSGNPSINISMFVFCAELESASSAYVDQYLAAMTSLEAEFPGVTFIYTTANTQVTGAQGYNRYQRNEQIRAYCAGNDKVLYDFADLDSWWYNATSGEWEHATYDYEGTAVPCEHPQWVGNDAAHTSYESCEQKTKAMWWLTASLTGWSSSPATGSGDLPLPSASSILDQNYPNPFNPSTMIAFDLDNAGHAKLDVFDAAGRFVKTLVDETLPAARHEVNWNGKDASGRSVASGVYFYSITSGGLRETKKMILLR